MSRIEINVLKESQDKFSPEDYKIMIYRLKNCPYENYEDCSVWGVSGDLNCLSDKCEIKEE